MSRTSFKNIKAALAAPFVKRFGILPNANGIDAAIDNNYAVKAASTTDTLATDYEIYRYDSANQFQLQRSVRIPDLTTRKFTLATNASLTTQAFWIADQAYTVNSITEIHATADGAVLTGTITKCTGTQAPTAGTTLMSGSFDLNGTANTLQTATLTSTLADLEIAAGDRLAFVPSGAVTSLAGVTITLQLAPGNKNETAIYNMALNGDIATQSFFVATRPMIVTGIQEIHSTKGTNGSAVTIDVYKDTSTNAPGAGTAMTTATLSLKSTINTVQSATLATSAATLRLAAGDRLSIKTSGTLTAVAGVVLVVTMQPVYAARNITYTLNANANLVDQTFFTADRPYMITGISEVHAVAGTNGSAVSLQVTADKATDAPGAGTDLLTNNTNVGFDMKGTANTVQVGTLAARGSLFLLAGDRLSVDYAGTLTTLAGVTVTVELSFA